MKECIPLFNNYQINMFDSLANESDTIEEFITAWVKDVKATKKIDPDSDPEKLTRQIIQVLEGAMTMWRLTGDIRYVEDLKEMVPLVARG